jgi:predicted Zn finger-like uncharacterized protein
MRLSEAELVNCPHCGTQYRLVRAEAGPESSGGPIECRKCGGPLNGRDGRFVLKYILVHQPRSRARASRVTA